MADPSVILGCWVYLIHIYRQDLSSHIFSVPSQQIGSTKIEIGHLTVKGVKGQKIKEAFTTHMLRLSYPNRILGSSKREGEER
jgi:hypothetical protein